MKLTQILRVAVLALLGSAASGGLQASSTWPGLMNYQGQLMTAAGAAVANGTYNITFNIYSVSTGGTSLWTETQSVTATNGLFDAVLGSVNSLTNMTGGLAAFNADLWVGVTVAPDSEMTPRQQLLTAGFAKNAQSLQGLVPNNSANNLVALNTSGQIPAGLIQDGSVNAPLDVTSASASYVLSLNNSAAASLGLSVTAANGAIVQASTGLGLSVTTQAAGVPALFAAGANPAQLLVSSAGANNTGLQVSTTANDQAVSLVDRTHHAGVWSNVSAASTYGVEAAASGASGVFGATSSPGLTDYGIWGLNNGSGTGAFGSGVTGVAGTTVAAPGFGVAGYNNGGGTIASGNLPSTGVGVEGQGLVGVQGQATQSGGHGVEGFVASSIAGTTYGVEGINEVIDGIGVRGRHGGAGAGAGVVGTSSAGSGAFGVYGVTSGTACIGVEGYSLDNNSFGVEGIQGPAYVTNTVGTVGAGVYGQGTYNAGTSTGYAEGVGVLGKGYEGVGAIGQNIGVYASSGSPAGANVFSDSSRAAQYGFYHSDPSPSGASQGVSRYGVYSVSNCQTCVAGFFYNTAAPGAANSASNPPVGAALSVQGRIQILGGPGASAGVLTVTAGSVYDPTDFPNTIQIYNPYIPSDGNCLVFLTAASQVAVVAAVTAEGPGPYFYITFSGAPPIGAVYQYLIIGQ